ncbi:MAG TPA: hypothetical protein VIH99_00795 [Bdellovibrionota bacterium]|jgi:hypothetical protein
MKFHKQASFWKNPGKSHGGGYRKGLRKVARPIATKKPMHIILRSSRARGAWNFHKHANAMEAAVYRISKRFRIRIYRYQNVGNHLHLGVQAASRPEFQNFLRVLPQAVAFLVTKTRKGNPIGRFWDDLVCSRVVEWGRDWSGLRKYFDKNKFEAAGVPRETIDLWFQKNVAPA